MFRYTCFFVALVIFSGCTKMNVDYDTLRNSSQLKVKNFSTLTSKNIKNDEAYLLKLGDEDKEVIKLGKQRVFASKLVLPKMLRPFSIDITSSSQVGFFAPKILFLDEKNKIVKTTNAKDLKFDRGFFKGTIFINKKFHNIKSLIVTQDLSKLKSSHELSTVSIVPMFIPVGPYLVTYIASSNDQNRTIRNAYGGNVKVLLKVYEPQILGSK